MIVAELQISVGRGFGSNPVLHFVKFNDLARARTEYDRVAGLFKDKGDKKNDLPKQIEIAGDGNSLTVYFDEITSIGICDFASANEQEAGVKDAYPHLFKR